MQHVRRGSSKIQYHFEWHKQEVSGQVLLKHKTVVNVSCSHERTLSIFRFCQWRKKATRERLLRYRSRKRKGRLALQFCQKINNNKVQKVVPKSLKQKKSKKKKYYKRGLQLATFACIALAHSWDSLVHTPPQKSSFPYIAIKRNSSQALHDSFPSKHFPWRIRHP